MREHYEPANLGIAGWHLQGILAATQGMETLPSEPQKPCSLKWKQLTQVTSARALCSARHPQAWKQLRSSRICSWSSQLDSKAAKGGISSPGLCDRTKGRRASGDKNALGEGEGLWRTSPLKLVLITIKNLKDFAFAFVKILQKSNSKTPQDVFLSFLCACCD